MGAAAGPSNEAFTASGEAPPPLAGLHGEITATGVLLQWQPGELGGRESQDKYSAHPALDTKKDRISRQGGSIALWRLIATTREGADAGGQASGSSRLRQGARSRCRLRPTLWLPDFSRDHDCCRREGGRSRRSGQPGDCGCHQGHLSRLPPQPTWPPSPILKRAPSISPGPPTPKPTSPDTPSTAAKRAVRRSGFRQQTLLWILLPTGTSPLNPEFRTATRSPRPIAMGMRARVPPRPPRLCRPNHNQTLETESMRYCRFDTESGPQYGVVAKRAGNDWIESLMPPPEEDAGARLAEDAMNFEPIPLGRAKLLAPVTPSKIVCIGRNYRDHAAGTRQRSPKRAAALSQSSFVDHREWRSDLHSAAVDAGRL